LKQEQVCPVRLRPKLINKTIKYIVSKFVGEHNHYLEGAEATHLIPLFTRAFCSGCYIRTVLSNLQWFLIKPLLNFAALPITAVVQSLLTEKNNR
jgi:hypothetical protein